MRAFNLGDKPGVASFNYQMFDIADRLDIRYNGNWVASTGNLFDEKTTNPDCGGNADGFVSIEGTLSFEYDPNISQTVEVYISGFQSGTNVMWLY